MCGQWGQTVCGGAEDVRGEIHVESVRGEYVCGGRGRGFV